MLAPQSHENEAAELAAFAAARAEAVTLSPPPEWVPAVADIPGVAGPYPCVIPEGQRQPWHLAAVRFDTDTAERIARDSLARFREAGDAVDLCVIRPDGVAEVRHFETDRDPRTGKTIRTREITEYPPDAEGRYAIGAGRWVRELYEVH